MLMCRKADRRICKFLFYFFLYLRLEKCPICSVDTTSSFGARSIMVWAFYLNEDVGLMIFADTPVCKRDREGRFRSTMYNNNKVLDFLNLCIIVFHLPLSR